MSSQSDLPFSEELFSDVFKFLSDCTYSKEPVKQESFLQSDDSFLQSASSDLTFSFDFLSEDSIHSDGTVESELLSTATSSKSKFEKNFYIIYSKQILYTGTPKYYITRSNIRNCAHGRHQINIFENGKVVSMGMKTSNVFIHKNYSCSKATMVEIYGSLPKTFIKCLHCFPQTV